MKRSDGLFELIKSMSKTEKRYFKIFSTHHALKGEKGYIKLFDAIDKQEEYDETKLLKIFPGKTRHGAKNYLYNLILKCLRVYHTGKSIDLELGDLIANVELLYNKQLYQECMKMLNKASDIALNSEKFLYIMMIFHWKYKVLTEMQNMEELEAMIKAAPSKELSYMEQYFICREHEWVISEIAAIYYEKGPIRNNSDALAYEAIAGKVTGKNDSMPLRAQILSHYISLFNAFIRSDYPQACHFTNNMIDTIESFPMFEKEYFRTYIKMLNNLNVFCLRLKKYDKMLECIKKVKALKSVSEADSNTIFFFSSNMELAYCNATGNFQAGIKTAEKLENKIQVCQRMFKQLYQDFCLKLASLYFGTGNYAKSLQWLNKILNKEIESGFNNLEEAHIINLLVHYELGHIDLLEYLIKQTYRFLYKKERLFQLETCILEFIKNEIFSGKSDQGITEAFKSLRDKLVILSEDPFEKIALEDFDYISWLESKIENRNFADIIKEKAKKQN